MISKYRRKFFITDVCFDTMPAWSEKWDKVILSETHNCFIHPELNFFEIKNKKFKVIIIGSYYHIEDDLQDFYNHLIVCDSLDDIHNAFFNVSGRYVVCISDIENKCNIIFSDSLSLRQVFYSKSDRCIVASDINILAELNEFNKSIHFDEEAKAFYDTDLKKVGTGNCWIGNDTIYKNIKKLSPNHQLNLNSYLIERYWPKSDIIEVSKETAATLITKFLKKILVDISKESDLTMAVTAGYDSRVLFAAAHKKIKNVTYFIDKKDSMAIDDSDIVIGKEVVEKFGYELHINHHSVNVDDIPKDFLSCYYGSSFFSGPTQLPTVYFYAKHYINKVNICGVGEIGRHRFGRNSFKPTAGFLAYKYGYVNSDYAEKKAQQWLSANHQLCSEYSINPYTLFYWEEDLGNWGAVGNSESDIAIEEINPYNCHKIFELMLGVDWKSSKLRDNDLFDRMIEILEPDLCELPINPSRSLISKFKRKLMNSRSYQYLDYIKYIYLTLKK